ncbi:MAG TPA: hypothetical protein ENJ54_09065 [Chloroflexi bacterium]|nr:hypothetical protein [Chloroflexota bacterium]
MKIIWTAYLRYRARVRGFDLKRLDEILRYGNERYYDTQTGRFVVVGRCGKQLCLVPYEIRAETITPVTVHATTRKQILQRVRVGRYLHVQG